MGKPTGRQIEYAKFMIEQLGYDPDGYDFDDMTFDEVSELIDELKDERGY